MSVLDFANEAAAAQNSGARRPTGNAQDRPKAKLWLNIGYEINGKFVNLPVGIPLDTMEPVAVRGQNTDWVQFQSARNALLKKIQAAGDQLQAGAEMTINGLEIRVRHVAEEIQVKPEENIYGVNMDDVFSVTVKEPVDEAKAS